MPYAYNWHKTHVHVQSLSLLTMPYADFHNMHDSATEVRIQSGKEIVQQADAQQPGRQITSDNNFILRVTDFVMQTTSNNNLILIVSDFVMQMTFSGMTHKAPEEFGDVAAKASDTL